MLALAGLLPARALPATQIDPARSRFEFSLQTRWGQAIEGQFPQAEGRVEVLPDGRHRVWLRLSAREVEIVGHPRYTAFVRGDGFFDVARFPEVEFLSEPYVPALLDEGGTLGGMLRMHGVSLHQAFTIAPSRCSRPARGCDVVAVGSVSRDAYGMGRWGIALSDQVRFSLRVRVLDEGDGA